MSQLSQNYITESKQQNEKLLQQLLLEASEKLTNKNSKMKFDTEELNKISIYDIAERLGITIKSGKANCFLHDDKTPSMSFNKRDNYWNCFGCGKGGGSIDLVIKKYDISFVDACKWLNAEFNINEIKAPYKKLLLRSEKNPIISKPISANTNNPDKEVYKWIIENTSLTDAAYEFLFSKKKFPASLISKLQIKSIEDSDSLYNDCELYFGLERLVKCGIVSRDFKVKDSYRFKWWKPTLLIPYFNFSGDIISIQGRSLIPSSKFRYVNLNMIETCIYNLQIVNYIKEGDKLYICEGVTDCISALAMGLPAIGIPGASGFKEKYVELLKPYKLIIIPDNDKAGSMFVEKIRFLFLQKDKEVLVSKLNKSYKDLSEYYIDKYSEL